MLVQYRNVVCQLRHHVRALKHSNAVYSAQPVAASTLTDA